MNRKVALLLVVALGLLLVGCGGKERVRVIVPAAGKTELAINYIPATEGEFGLTMQVAGNATMVVVADKTQWIYDIPEDVVEYAVAGYYRAFGSFDYYEIHLRSSKKPK